MEREERCYFLNQSLHNKPFSQSILYLFCNWRNWVFKRLKTWPIPHSQNLTESESCELPGQRPLRPLHHFHTRLFIPQAPQNSVRIIRTIQAMPGTEQKAPPSVSFPLLSWMAYFGFIWTNCSYGGRGKRNYGITFKKQRQKVLLLALTLSPFALDSKSAISASSHPL